MVVAFAVLATGFTTVGSVPQNQPSAAQRADPAEAVGAAPATPAAVTSPQGFSIPSIGMAVGLEQGSVVDGVLDPGNTSEAWVVSRPPLMVVAMHSSTARTSAAIGNGLWDRDAGRSRVNVGDLIAVEGGSYRVTGWVVIAKPDLAYSSVWTSDADLLVITCAERPDEAPSIDNLVISAVKA